MYVEFLFCRAINFWTHGSVATVLRTGMKCKLLFIQERLGIVNMVDATRNFLCIKKFLRTLHVCVNVKCSHSAESVSKKS